MAPLQENNVVFDPAGHYVSVADEPIWSSQKMAGTTNFDGAFPAIGATAQRPVISPGQAKWSALDHGGLFSFQSSGRPVVVLDRYTNNVTTAAYVILMQDGVTTRAFPSAFPFTLAAGEKIQVTSSSVGSTPEIGFLAKFDTSERV